MKKRILSALLALVLVFSMISMTACGNNGTTAASNFEVPEVGYDGSDVTISFYTTMGSNLTTVLNLYIEEFNKL